VVLDDVIAGLIGAAVMAGALLAMTAWRPVSEGM
jgi:hypothetical protein